MASDLLKPDPKLLFCGYNPSLCTGYHYVHPGNRFWHVLFAAGITDRLYRPEEDSQLLNVGIAQGPEQKAPAPAENLSGSASSE